eukprot:gnl/MRDRNA2_/MRDRNA2_104621_c0_seq1.p1 gnl/MRDRNA2_/MRDRNA2_104621_c0~~gnl/MRDRNA2_/MRDRNA2_104621_c0_seq1.p1  ORF type:complete len:405 (+),score=126.10 gnl/MRDRNA2_/MRDRNA2_104621_c0_seq1:117-1331(+)
MSSPQVAVRLCPPEIDDATFDNLMQTRNAPIPVSSSKPRCVEPEGEPDSEVVWASKPSWGQSIPMKRPAFLGSANVPNLIRKVGMCMMMLSAVALNLTVIGALVKSQQAPAVATTPSAKPKSAVVRPEVFKVKVPLMNATAKAKAQVVPETAAPEEPEKQPEEHEDKVLSDSAAHFIIPVPMPPKVPLPPTIQEHIHPTPETLPPKESIGSTLHAKQQDDSNAFEESQDGVSVKMLLPGTEAMHTKDEALPETQDEKEERERKKLRALLVEAEENLGDEEGRPTSQSMKFETKSFKTQSTGSGRLHMKDPNVMAHGAGGGMQAKWGAEVRQKLVTLGSEEAARKGPAKFMRMESTSTASLDSFTRQIKEAKAKQEEEEEKDKENDSSLLNEVKKALPSTVFGFR